MDSPPPFTGLRRKESEPTVLMMTSPRTSPTESHPRRAGSGAFSLFTALEATLLDAVTLDAGTARKPLHHLQKADVQVIGVTAMTLDEAAPVAEALTLRAMIIEAGGAIARRRRGVWEVEPCGPPSDELLEAVRVIEDRSGAELTVYSVQPEEVASRLSGRTGQALQASLKREFSEPFVIDRGSYVDVAAAAAAIGFSLRRSGRFLYLCRESHEHVAFSRLRRELGRCSVIAVGSNPIDADILSESDFPIIVPHPDGSIDEELRALVPHARIAPAPGPAGWAVAVEEEWRSLTMSHRGTFAPDWQLPAFTERRRVEGVKN